MSSQNNLADGAAAEDRGANSEQLIEAVSAITLPLLDGIFDSAEGMPMSDAEKQEEAEEIARDYVASMASSSSSAAASGAGSDTNTGTGVGESEFETIHRERRTTFWKLMALVRTALREDGSSPTIAQRRKREESIRQFESVTGLSPYQFVVLHRGLSGSNRWEAACRPDRRGGPTPKLARVQKLLMVLIQLRTGKSVESTIHRHAQQWHHIVLMSIDLALASQACRRGK